MKNPKSLQALSLMLTQCHGTLHDIFFELGEQRTKPRKEKLDAIACILSREVEASYVLSQAIKDTSVGWPDDPDSAITYMGARSGYSAELVTGFLSGAASIARVSSKGMFEMYDLQHIDHATVYSYFCGVETLIQQAAAVVEHALENVEPIKEAAAG